MFYLIKKFHKFEYETNQKSMFIFFVNMLAVIFVDTVNILLISDKDICTPTICFIRLSGIQKYQAMTEFFGSNISW